MSEVHDADVVVIGAGFYGLTLALELVDNLGAQRVIVLEQEPAAMERASYVNQARVHQGYHYPRNLLTAGRSRASFERFVSAFRPAIVDSFEKFYAVARDMSKVSASQFTAFCDRIGAPWRDAGPAIYAHVDTDLIEAVFAVTEYAFDARVLRDLQLAQVARREGQVEVRYGVRVERIVDAGGLAVLTSDHLVRAPIVLNTTYSGINRLGRASGLPLLPFKHEVTEMAVVKPTGFPTGAGITVMDGPFFSLMPFPPLRRHSFSHVRYTPHFSWADDASTPDDYHDPYRILERYDRRSAFSRMYADARRYLPRLKLDYEDSLWEIKTVLRQSEGDDGRPILFAPNCGVEGYTCIMGGKIDNIFDAIGELRDQLSHAISADEERP